jgi:hypothetical protein
LRIRFVTSLVIDTVIYGLVLHQHLNSPENGGLFDYMLRLLVYLYPVYILIRVGKKVLSARNEGK